MEPDRRDPARPPQPARLPVRRGTGLALRIVSRSLFSADVSQTAEEFTRAFLVANQEFARFFRFPFPPLTVPTPSHRRMRAAIAVMDRFVLDFVRRVLNLVTGAYETTTNALSWAFWLLARHPEVEQRFHAEVDRLTGVPSFADLTRLPYTRMIVDETLRLYSPAWQRHARGTRTPRSARSGPRPEYLESLVDPPAPGPIAGVRRDRA